MKIFTLFVLVFLFINGCKSPELISDVSLKDIREAEDFSYYNPNVKYRGSNMFPFDPEEKFRDASEIYNMNIVRILCGDNEYAGTGFRNSFLYGDTDNFTTIKEDHLDMLDKRVEWAKKYNLAVVIDLHHAAGRQWSHHRDYKLYQDFKYHDMTVEFWKQMAEHYKNEGADVMFDLFNESYGFAYYAETIGWENIETVEDGNYSKESIIEYNERVKGTPADINLFYKSIVSAIREIDENRVIILQPESWASPSFMRIMNPVYKENGELDENVWYSFHFYLPHGFTHQEVEKFRYPGTVSNEWVSHYWDKGALRKYFDEVEEWLIKNNIPLSSIFCGEFNAVRYAKGTDQWLLDVTNLLEEYGYNWTYYAFREDNWDGMDCELGPDYSNRDRDFTPIMEMFYEKFRHNR